ncbi:hypothetical protein V1506DRAFT_507365 [Lipomyces tetrasporus]
MSIKVILPSRTDDAVIATVRSKGKEVDTLLASLPNVTLVELAADNLVTIDSAVLDIEQFALEALMSYGL